MRFLPVFEHRLNQFNMTAVTDVEAAKRHCPSVPNNGCLFHNSGEFEDQMTKRIFARSHSPFATSPTFSVFLGVLLPVRYVHSCCFQS